MFRKTKWIIAMIGTLVALVSAAGVLAYVTLGKSTQETLPTYFSYTPHEVESLRALQSNKEMTIDEVYRWEDTLYDLVSAEKLRPAQSQESYHTWLLPREIVPICHSTHIKNSKGALIRSQGKLPASLSRMSVRK